MEQMSAIDILKEEIEFFTLGNLAEGTTTKHSILMYGHLNVVPALFRRHLT